MMQAAESLLRKYPTRSYGTNPAVGCSLPESEMCAVVMIVVDIISEQPFQMALIQRDDVVQQISPTAFHPALRYTILPRTFEGGPHRTHAQRSNGVRDRPSVLRIPVEDQKPGSRLEWKRLPQLRDDPQSRRMTGDVAVQDAPTIVADHEEAVEKAERDRGYGEEVHRRNDFPRIAKETEPTSCRLRISWRSFHPA